MNPSMTNQFGVLLVTKKYPRVVLVELSKDDDNW